MKNIVVLSDGTGNGAAKRHKTNVWRIYEALDLHAENQIAMYDDGVGSKDTLPNKILGGAFGYGLKRNVIEMYKFLCREYRQNDQSKDKIYLFGFSRGAFTVRVLAGLITSVGLCREWDGPQELDQESRRCYREYRQKYLNELKGRYDTLEIDTTKRVVPQIEFVGVWDTVDAYGFPIDEIAAIWHNYVYPFRFSNRNLSEKILRACHAISVDDERKTFHPVLWNEKNGDDTRIKQFWFAGVHADVGGGYPRKSLSLVSLDWMIAEVEKTTDRDGLVFIDQVRSLYHQQSDWNGPQHDSRARLGVFYRYKPREIAKLSNDSINDVSIEVPKIHQSVFERIKGHGHQYFPIGIPAEYQVLTSTGENRVYEEGDKADKRFEAMKPVWEIVQRRSKIYVLMALTATLLVLVGFFPVSPSGHECSALPPVVGWIQHTIEKILPEFMGQWIDGVFCSFLVSGALILGLSALYAADVKGKRKLRELAVKAWKSLNR